MDNAVCLHNATVLTGFSAMQNCAVYIKDNKIADVYNEERFQKKVFKPGVKIINVNGAYIAPGFIDTHIHGIGGFSADDADSSSILRMSEILASYGVTSFIPTIGASPENELMPKIRAVVEAMGQERGAHILGIHLEGPFLSPEKIGGQQQDGISPVDLNYMQRIWEASEGKIINMTVAPELKDMRKLALFCIEHDIILQAGHTNATYDQMIEGMQVNIMHVTHMFNAMRPLHHREPGVAGAALVHPEISCEVIPDGFHISPHLIKLLIKTKPLSQLVLITDSLKPAKTELSPDADIYLDKCFIRKADGVLVGSAITMLDGIRNLASFGIPLDKIIRMAAANPARIMKQAHKGQIIPGYDADLTVFNHDFQIIHTVINGQFVEENAHETANKK